MLSALLPLIATAPAEANDERSPADAVEMPARRPFLSPASGAGEPPVVPPADDLPALLEWLGGVIVSHAQPYYSPNEVFSNITRIGPCELGWRVMHASGVGRVGVASIGGIDPDRVAVREAADGFLLELPWRDRTVVTIGTDSFAGPVVWFATQPAAARSAEGFARAARLCAR